MQLALNVYLIVLNHAMSLQVSSRIREDLLARASEFRLILEDVSITHLTFGKEFTQVGMYAAQGVVDVHRFLSRLLKRNKLLNKVRSLVLLPII